MPGTTLIPEPDEHTFELDDFPQEYWDKKVPVFLAKDLTREELLDMPAFRSWKSSIKTSLANQKYSDHAFNRVPYSLRSITIQSFDKFNPKSKTINFVKMKADIRNGDNKPLPGIVFLRGGSVAILMIVRPSDSPDERWVIMTEQPRVPSGSLTFMGIPAGMMDADKNVLGKAVDEIQEEVGMRLLPRDLVDMTELAVRGHKVQDDLKMAMYPSPGGSDEWISILLWEKELSWIVSK